MSLCSPFISLWSLFLSLFAAILHLYLVRSLFLTILHLCGNCVSLCVTLFSHLVDSNQKWYSHFQVTGASCPLLPPWASASGLCCHHPVTVWVRYLLLTYSSSSSSSSSSLCSGSGAAAACWCFCTILIPPALTATDTERHTFTLCTG